LLLKLQKARKKLVLFFIPIFMIRDPVSGAVAFSPPGSGIRIRDKKVRDPDPG
jgi:hypothetical protein